jgi:hypothetical protein
MLNLEARWGWVANATPRPLCPRQNDPVPYVLEAAWAPGAVCKGFGKSRIWCFVGNQNQSSHVQRHFCLCREFNFGTSVCSPILYSPSPPYVKVQCAFASSVPGTRLRFKSQWCYYTALSLIPSIFVLHHKRLQRQATTETKFLGALAKQRAVTISHVISIPPSVRLHETTRLPMNEFQWNLIYEYF